MTKLKYLKFSGASAIILGVLVTGARAEPITRCDPTTDPLKYNCMVKFNDNGGQSEAEKKEGMVNLNMPSMPMAHNERPVKFEQDENNKGQYNFDVKLPMHGVWSFVYDVNTPHKKRYRTRLLFEKGKTAESNKKIQEKDRHIQHHSGHDHSKHK